MTKMTIKKRLKKPSKPTIKRLIILAILLALILPGLYNGVKIQHYTVKSDRISSPFRIALVTDLHSDDYDESLVKTIAEQNPDIILLGGDIFDDVADNSGSERFIKEIAPSYPSYYVTGNHEFWGTSESFSEQIDILESNGVHILSGECKEISINGAVFTLCGVDDPDKSAINTLEGSQDNFHEQLKGVSESISEENFTLLLSHRPEYFELYADYGFDLVLCGHAHGGQWRIPFILNGLFAPNQGLFPKYAGGEYEENGTKMIVSRGLSTHSTIIPRIYNRPELVIIDVE